MEITIRDFGDVVRFNIEHGLKHSILGLGAPGIGKSETMAQIADELGYNLQDLRLAQMSEVEIGGLIYPSADKTYTEWLRPNWFPTGKEGKPTMLLLDELTSASKRVQVAAYQLVLDRRIGKHVLPDDTVIVGLGNREQDKGVYVELAAPLANRFEIYEIACDADIWLEDFAIANCSPLVSSYIHRHKGDLHTQSEDEDRLIFASPRSWTRVSETLMAVNNQINEVVRNKIYAFLGDDLGSRFLQYVEMFMNNENIQRILNGDYSIRVTATSDIIYLIYAFTKILQGDVVSDRELAMKHLVQFCQYAHTFPSELEMMCVIQLSRVDAILTADALNKKLFPESYVRTEIYNRLLQSALDENDREKLLEIDTLGVDEAVEKYGQDQLEEDKTVVRKYF